MPLEQLDPVDDSARLGCDPPACGAPPGEAPRKGSMRSELRNWAEILRTQNLSSGRPMDPVSRWLLIARASLFPLTITSGAIGGLLAAGNPDARWGCFAIALFALIANAVTAYGGSQGRGRRCASGRARGSGRR